VESDLHGSRNVEREGAFLPGTTRNCPEFSMHRLLMAALSAIVLALSSCRRRRPKRFWRTKTSSPADGYRKQLETNYALKLPPEQVTPFIDARFNIKGSAEYPRWLRAFVSSAQMIYREPVVHEIPLITQPTLFVMGADDHNAPGRANAPEALRAKMGQNAELAKALATKMANGRAEVIPDTGHLVFLEAPAKYDELMLGFLAAP
jgi:pimeloyl-ACP methyl ester carboxylesterase